MKRFPALVLALTGCSTVQGRLADEPQSVWTTKVPSASFNECFVRSTANENVAYLPRHNGGTFKSSAGPQNYVFWLLTVSETGPERQIVIQALNQTIARKVAVKAKACS